MANSFMTDPENQQFANLWSFHILSTGNMLPVSSWFWRDLATNVSLPMTQNNHFVTMICCNVSELWQTRSNFLDIYSPHILRVVCSDHTSPWALGDSPVKVILDPFLTKNLRTNSNRHLDLTSIWITLVSYLIVEYGKSYYMNECRRLCQEHY